MIYTMNGMVTHLELRGDEVGTFQGLSAHFSGDGFPDMLFDVHVVCRSVRELGFKNSSQRSRLNSDSYQALLNNRCRRTSRNIGWRSATVPAITTQKIPPGPGPRQAAEIGAGNVPVS